jgi:menaquinol-cytochrome c reductase iron-sulfur subunit
MEKTPNISRRDFVTIVSAVLGAVMGAAIGIPAIGYLISPALNAGKSDAWIPAGNLDNFPVGTPTLFTFTRTKVNGWEKTSTSYGVYVVRKSETQIEILSNRCTHLSCRVTWKPDANEYVCPCHDGRFDIDGNVTKQPPPRPLDRYEHKIENNALFIRFLEG